MPIPNLMTFLWQPIIIPHYDKIVLSKGYDPWILVFTANISFFKGCVLLVLFLKMSLRFILLDEFPIKTSVWPFSSMAMQCQQTSAAKNPPRFSASLSHSIEQKIVQSGGIICVLDMHCRIDIFTSTVQTRLYVIH